MFIDIGAAFITNALDSFEKVKGAKCKPFDMQRHTRQQGFKSNFNLIVVPNVIHATRHIQRTLENVRRLLKPSGETFLFKSAKPRLCGTLTLGTFSDIWNGYINHFFFQD